MLITIEKNNYVESMSEREEIVQMIVDAFIAKMHTIENNYETARWYGLEYCEKDNGLYVSKGDGGTSKIHSCKAAKGAIRVSAREMQIAFDCLHRGGYYYYEAYYVSTSGTTYKQCWWWKKPSFLNLIPSKCPTFNWFIG